MINKTLAKLEARIRAAGSRDDASQDELLALVAQLRGELGAIAETHADDAVALAQRAGEAPSPDDDDGSVEDTIREFEAAHPQIVGIVRSLMKTLADAGI